MNNPPLIKYELRANADPTVMRVIPELAEEIGLNESIMLLQIAFWIKLSENEREGEYWTYQSVRGMKEDAFPFWSVDTINRTAQALISNKYLKCRTDFNTRKSDKTRWFAFDVEGLSALQSITIVESTEAVRTPVRKGVRTPVRKSDSLPQNRTALYENRTTLPESTTETTQKEPQERPRIFALYEELCGTTITSFMADELKDAAATYQADWIEDAFKEAALNNAKNWKYVLAILKRWTREGKIDRKTVVPIQEPPPLKVHHASDELRAQYEPGGQYYHGSN